MSSDKGAKVFADDRKYVFHSWSAQAQISPIPVESGSGSYFWDFDGKKYLDFSCQLVFTNIGHQHPKVVQAIKDQADLLTTIAPQHANEARNGAAQRIVELAGEGFDKVFFTNAGADGIENAVRMARLHTGKTKIFSTYRSYHGNTGAPTLSLEISNSKTMPPSGVMCGVTSNLRLALRNAKLVAPLAAATW